jgi:predicted PurR-regulated permease PerM
VTAERQLRFWLIGLALFGIALYLLRGVLLPFVAGMAVAYLLDPVCDRLERWGCSRTLATCLVLGGFILVAAFGLMLLVPLIQRQAVDLAMRLPDLIQSVVSRAGPILHFLQERYQIEGLAQLRSMMGGQIGGFLQWLANALGRVVTGGLALFNLLSLIFITPIVTFYLLRDWDRLVARIDAWLPRQHAAVIRAQVRLIDRTLAGYARGQATVCVVLGVFYAVGLTLIGLDYGLSVGLLAGLLSFIPFVGAIVGFATAIGLAFAQFADWMPIVLVGAVFVIGQALEGNFLTPKLVGDRVGLHPVWVIFALLAGGALFGFVGVLLALPAAAVTGVLTRFALERYLGSSYYRGDSTDVANPSVPPLPGSGDPSVPG